MRKPHILFAFFVLIGSLARGQEILQLEDVIKLILENNFDVQVAKNNIRIAKNNNNIGLVGGGQSTGGTVSGGATGILPQISIAAGSPQNPLGVGQTIATLKYADPTLNVDNRKLTSSNYAASIIGTWFFFDGLKMFATKKKLNRYEDLSDLQYRLVVENTMLNTLNYYYRMISIQQLIKSLKVSLKLAGDQKDLSAAKFKNGSGSQVDVLQTQIDYNTIRVQIIQQQNLLNEQRVNLNNALKRSPDLDFGVPDTILIQTKPEYRMASESTDKNNTSVLISKKGLEIDELSLQEFRANRFPKIGITGNYTIARTTNDIGLLRVSQNSGYNAGFIFSWTLLNNFTTRTAIRNQIITLNSDNLNIDASKRQGQSNLYKAYLEFQSNLNTIDIEKESVQLAKQNLTIANERFKVGLSNYIEYRTVEQSYEAAVYRLSQAAFNTKVSELNYLKEQGLLVR